MSMQRSYISQTAPTFPHDTQIQVNKTEAHSTMGDITFNFLFDKSACKVRNNHFILKFQ